MKKEVIETDVLCVGAGIAGLMAGIKSRELGLNVVVVEKGNALHSGRGRAGNDHFWCYLPEVHGNDIEVFLKESLKGPKMKAMQSGTSSKVMRTFLERSFDIVKMWDEWGIPMKYNGKWEFAGHSFPGEVLTHLKYEGQMQKPVLVKKAMEKGAVIINRLMVLDLLHDDEGVIGAVGMNTREDKIIIFKAKSIILGTGISDGLYPPPTPGWMASTGECFNLTGDGRAMTYRAGGELVGAEILRRHIGPRYFCKGGQSTWIGVLKDPQGKPVGPYLSKPDRKYSDMTMEVNSVLPEEYMKTGRGPVYMDCRGISEEDYMYMMHWLKHEGNVALIEHMKEEHIDPRENPIEFGTYNIRIAAKIWINGAAETSIGGLYATGDESIVGIGPAAVYGWIAGENAAQYAKKKQVSKTVEGAEAEISEKSCLVERISSRKEGPDWREATIALQQIMQDYAGLIRSETLLTAGLCHLRRLKEKVNATLMARNQWELTRCFELFNLLDLGELVFAAAIERKETRGLHKRSDYPLTDPRLDDKWLFIKRDKEGPITKWRKME